MSRPRERVARAIKHLLNRFDGKLTSSKWDKLDKCSQGTALRDIDDLLERGILVKDADGGRNICCSRRGLLTPHPNASPRKSGTYP